eukprot:gnl/TRDRNA2_/TRDRNA2_186676_c0_seq1.p1 gnl/TRDRNA2_/TRDRNA2_186676_c0~~gnl/TRDRNA2_/TRDRNA2_186676_c0_seq1.p1  ORF type:complete len:430 (+),score=78.69 gnl/TRDRNA2_/TRDRNA2_186676_c0_seq1:93-1382(+)
MQGRRRTPLHGRLRVADAMAAFFLALPLAGGSLLSSVNGSDASVGGTPKLFFLFMAYGGLPNSDIWAKFFSNSAHGREYEALLHCVDEASCRKNVSAPFEVIATVPSQWCEDLVSPMNALLRAALNKGGGGADGAARHDDKFIFASDTTVPIKPFSFVHHRIGIEDGSASSFCIKPWHNWAWFDAKRVAPKHDQWITLSRAHAAKAVAMGEQEDMHPPEVNRQMVPLHWAGVEWLAPAMYEVDRTIELMTKSKFFRNIRLAPNNGGCIDEFWHFAALYGNFDRKDGRSDKLLDVPGLGSSERLHMDEHATRQPQGRCDTYVRFTDHDFPNLSDLLKGDPDTVLEKAGSVTGKHPKRFEQVSEKSLKALRASQFLFARKVDRRTRFADERKTLPEAFDEYIFSKDATNWAIHEDQATCRSSEHGAACEDI